MSEYQYYEFRALDRGLSEREQAALGEVSSRAKITATSFVNEYNYGDFHGNVEALLTKYFDVLLYVANWGQHRLAFGLPADLVEVTELKRFCLSHGVSLKKHGKRLVLDFDINQEEGGGWEQGEGYLKPLLPIRDELLQGDLRPAYLAWLAAAYFGYEEAESLVEPPVPPGLSRLTAAQRALAEFLWLPDSLIEAAAEESGGKLAAARVPTMEFDDWIVALPGKEKDQLLRQLVAGDDPHLLAQLRQRYLKEATPKRATAARTKHKGRTFAQLHARAEELEARPRKGTRKR